MDLLENCSECYEFCLSEFPNSIIIQGNLSPRTIYFARLTDSFGNRYIIECPATDMSGTLTIPGVESNVPQWPNGWLNRNAGKFKIEISLEISPWLPVDFAFDASGYSPFYPCLWISFVNDNSNNNIVT